LHDGDGWPVVSLDGYYGSSIHLVFRNYSGDSGWDYLLTIKPGAVQLCLAALEGHFRGPGISWPELLALSGLKNDQRAERLLLLLPMLGDVATPRTAEDTVMEALSAIGATSETSRVASQLLSASSRSWGPTEWTTVTGDVPVCLGSHSDRHPGRRSPAELVAVAAALNG